MKYPTGTKRRCYPFACQGCGRMENFLAETPQEARAGFLAAHARHLGLWDGGTRRALDVLEGRRRWGVVQGDALDVLRRLPDACVDAVCTDPPYSSGGQFRGDRAKKTSEKYVDGDRLTQYEDFAGDTRDQRGFIAWSALWLSECLRVAKDDAILQVFTDWRQLPAMTDAVQAGGWIWRGVLPWDKTEAARPTLGGYRSQCEFVVWATKGSLALRAHLPAAPGVIRAASRDAEKIHMAAKPVGVLLDLLSVVQADAVVLDPYLGSGSSGVAALRSGRRVIGIEIEETWAKTARERIAAEERGLDLSAARAGQVGLFEQGGDAA